MKNPCLRTLSSTLPNRESSPQTIVRLSLVVRHTLSCYVTTIDHEVANGWRWGRKSPKSTIVTQILARYSPWTWITTRTTATTPTISMNSSTTKTAMRSFHSRSDRAFLTNCYLYFHFGHVDILSKPFITYTLMETTRVKYTINPETGRKIKVGTLIWKRLVAKYYMFDGAFTDHIIPDSRVLKVKDDKTCKACKRVVDPAGIKRYIIVGSKAWNERYLMYEWNDHEFGKRRKQSLPEFMSTVRRDEKHEETSSTLCLIAKLQKELAGCDSFLTWILSHLLSNRGWEHVQGMDEWEMN